MWAISKWYHIATIKNTPDLCSQNFLFLIHAVHVSSILVHSWIGNWQLHLGATECFVKYFFAHDKLNYARLIPMYLGDMKSLAWVGPWNMERIHGWKLSCEQKCNSISFHFVLLELIMVWNRLTKWWKSVEDFIGITQNHNALMKFFHVALELFIIANEAHGMAGLKSAKTTTHYQLLMPWPRDKRTMSWSW